MPPQAQTAAAQAVQISWVQPITTRDGTLAKDSRMTNCFLEATAQGNAVVKRPGTAYVSTQQGKAQGQLYCAGAYYYIVNDIIYPYAVAGVPTAIPGVYTAGLPYDTLSDVPVGTSLVKSSAGLWVFKVANSTAAATVAGTATATSGSPASIWTVNGTVTGTVQNSIFTGMFTGTASQTNGTTLGTIVTGTITSAPVSGAIMPDGSFQGTITSGNVVETGGTTIAITGTVTSPTSVVSIGAISITQVMDINYPADTVPGLTYLDGVYYVMSTEGQVQGSALEDPMTWPALDFIQADFTLGVGTGLIRHLNYIIAFYSQGVQFYYDANAAPNTEGIALGPVPNASWRTGCVQGYTLLEMSDLTYFVAQNNTYGRTIQQFNGLTMVQISTPFIEKIINRSSFVDAWSFGLKTVGHQFYCLTMPDINTTVVFDLISQQWFTWSSVVNGVEQYFTGRFYLNDGTRDLLQDVSTGMSIEMTPELFTDATGEILVTCVSIAYDWGNLNWKRFSAMFQLGDTAATTIGISYSDDDYSTWSTPRTVDLSTVRKQLRNCGASRRRAWRMQHSDNTPLRLYDLVVPMAMLER